MLSRAKFFQVFSQKIKTAVIFYLLANPAETPYLRIRDGKLSNAVWLVKFRRRKVAVHTFLGWSQAGILRRPSRRNYRKPYLFCLRSYPGEISHSNSPNRGLSNDISDLVVRRRKVALQTSSHLTPTEAPRSPDSTTSKGRRVSSEVRLGNCTHVWGVGQI